MASTLVISAALITAEYSDSFTAAARTNAHSFIGKTHVEGIAVCLGVTATVEIPSSLHAQMTRTRFPRDWQLEFSGTYSVGLFSAEDDAEERLAIIRRLPFPENSSCQSRGNRASGHLRVQRAWNFHGGGLLRGRPQFPPRAFCR